MTKREAYENLKDYLDNVFHNSNDYETYCYLRDCADTLAPPDPDPITGLVPCGCGGKAGFHYSVMMRDNDCYVECGICGVHTKVVLSEDKARDAWNTAMGWKGGAE